MRIRDALRGLTTPDALPRRLARRVGLGRLLRRLGVPALLRARRDALPARPEPGVLLVGHPYGVLGVGEYLRSSAAAFAAAGIPFHIRNAFDGGELLRDRHPGFPYWHRLTGRNPHRVNVLHLNADEMAALRRHLGKAFFAGRYTIASWHWELSRFPDAWLPALEGVDELWASSRFIERALAATARVPVIWMPHPVDTPAPRPLERRELGLPEEPYLFLTSFDFTSYVTRKNPLGAVRAFRAAFPDPSDRRAGLVVKANGAALRPREAERFLAAPELRDPRIVVLNQTLDRPTVMGLFACCDSFVSLHRSEGFGRGLAEAMLLGKPVIATGYSGNMDFMDVDDGCVVDYRLVPVREGEYPHAAGQHWADPDLEQAAGYMRRLLEQPPWAAALGARGRRRVLAQHGVAAVGRRCRERLEALGLLEPD